MSSTRKTLEHLSSATGYNLREAVAAMAAAAEAAQLEAVEASAAMAAEVVRFEVAEAAAVEAVVAVGRRSLPQLLVERPLANSFRSRSL